MYLGGLFDHLQQCRISGTPGVVEIADFPYRTDILNCVRFFDRRFGLNNFDSVADGWISA